MRNFLFVIMPTPHKQKQLDKVDAAVKKKGRKNRKSKKSGKADLQAAGASADGGRECCLVLLFARPSLFE